MQVKSIWEGEHSAIFSTYIKLQFVINIFDLSIFELLLETGFTLDYLRVLLKKGWYRLTRPTLVESGWTY